MYIRRKVFSLLQDETGEERYFSTNEITLEDAEQRIFSKKEVKLGESKENGGLANFMTGYSGKKALKEADKAAERAAKEGKSEEEIVEAAKKQAKKTGGRWSTASVGALSAGVGLQAYDPLINEAMEEGLNKFGKRIPKNNVRATKAVSKLAEKVGKHRKGTAAVIGAGTAVASLPLIGVSKRIQKKAAEKRTIDRIKKGKEE